MLKRTGTVFRMNDRFRRICLWALAPAGLLLMGASGTESLPPEAPKPGPEGSLVGGTATTDKHREWVRLEFSKLTAAELKDALEKDDKIVFDICVGAFISSRVIITAAHCAARI